MLSLDLAEVSADEIEGLCLGLRRYAVPPQSIHQFVDIAADSVERLQALTGTEDLECLRPRHHRPSLVFNPVSAEARLHLVEGGDHVTVRVSHGNDTRKALVVEATRRSATRTQSLPRSTRIPRILGEAAVSMVSAVQRARFGPLMPGSSNCRMNAIRSRVREKVEPQFVQHESADSVLVE